MSQFTAAQLDLKGVGFTSKRARDRMVAKLRELGVSDERVLTAMRNTARHAFIEDALHMHAYENKSLPIGLKQTISQPYIVARMTELLLAGRQMNQVLEIGTGCGYQSAILSAVVPQVYSVERLQLLQDRAKQVLQRLGCDNITFVHSDGGWGWPGHAPYDGILVTCAPETIPEQLKRQLKIGGRMVIPCGSDGKQQLVMVDRLGDEQWIETAVEAAQFVPLREGALTVDDVTPDIEVVPQAAEPCFETLAKEPAYLRKARAKTH